MRRAKAQSLNRIAYALQVQFLPRRPSPLATASHLRLQRRASQTCMSQISTSSSPRYWPLGQLVLARLREFLREPEAVFWVYGFPILMTVGLGIAFKNRPIEEISVVIVEGPAAETAREALASSKTSERFDVEIVSAEEARRKLRTGRTALVVDANNNESHRGETDSKPRYVYQFDPTRADSVLARK